MSTECYIVRDLLALYAEQMVSEETARFIKEHLAGCADCRAELEALQAELVATLPADDGAEAQKKPFQAILRRINRQFDTLAYSLIIFFVFLGFSLTNGENLMYNSLIMPIVGVFGYYVFGWRAVYKLPVLLLLIDLLIFAFGIFEIGLVDTLGWTLIYCIFVFIGVAIAFLLHYAFRREEQK